MELGSGEIILILIVALLVYGGRLPEVARAIGKSVAELKRGLTETKEVVEKELQTGLSVSLDEPEEPPRETWRAPPAPSDLAKEDISKPAGESERDLEYDPKRHEHPN
jgi:sec-independent protein translocase protein TatA